MPHDALCPRVSCVGADEARPEGLEVVLELVRSQGGVLAALAGYRVGGGLAGEFDLNQVLGLATGETSGLALPARPPSTEDPRARPRVCVGFRSARRC